MRSNITTRRTGPYMAAMVLGTALSAFAPTAVQATTAQNTPAVAELSRYCTACWRNARLPIDTWNDCTQEVLCRLMQRVPMDVWDRTLRIESEEHRELVRAIDAVKKRTQRAKKWNAQALELVADRRDPQRRDLSEERAAVRQAATELLTPRQQQILQLSFEGWSVQEIGKNLDLSAERISDEKYKAIRKLRAHLAEER
jgi:RNA polymerase sigma factor (sigma-70 family)